MSGRPLQNPNAVHPDCMLCRDTGLIYLPDFPPAYRFCKCRKGVERQAAEPNVVEEANAREQALGILRDGIRGCA